MNRMYPVLEGKIAERGIRKTAIAGRLGISGRAFSDKLNGVSDFKWDEVKVMQAVFFPDITKDELMRTEV